MVENYPPADNGQGPGPGAHDGQPAGDQPPAGQPWFGPPPAEPPPGQPSTGEPPAADPAAGSSPSEPAEYWGPFGRGPEFASQPSGWPPPTTPGYPAYGAPYPPPFGGTAPGSGPLAAATALVAPPGRGRSHGPRAGTVVGAAALTAVLIGGAAGYGGSLLAARSQTAQPAVSASPALPSDPAGGAPSVTASPLPPAPGQANTVEIAKRVLPGTVMIQVGSSTGSGFVLDRSGAIMTNNHVVAGAADGGRLRVVFADGRRVAATLVGRSPSYDLAVIRVARSERLQPLPVGDSEQAVVGQPVIAVGSPLGLPGTVTQGIVSARDRPVVVNADAAADAPTAYINAIQTDAPINPGNSGGPLIDAAGRVIGVNSAILTLGSSQGQTGNIGLGFAIPINQATQIGRQLITNGKARYPVIGATVSDESSADGVEITTVEAGGPAARAGLRTGDVVTRIDTKPVSTMEELIVTIRTRRPGQSVVLDYTRGSARRTATVVLGSKEG